MTQRSQPNLIQALLRWLFSEPLIQVVKGIPEKTTIKNVRQKKRLHRNNKKQHIFGIEISYNKNN